MYIKFYFPQSLLIVEVWDADKNPDDKIDNFTFPLNTSLHKFNTFNSHTVKGYYGIGKLTLTYGNLTVDETSCTAAVPTISSINSSTLEGDYL